MTPEAEKVLHSIDSDYRKCQTCNEYYKKKGSRSKQVCDSCYELLHDGSEIFNNPIGTIDSDVIRYIQKFGEDFEEDNE